MKLLISSNYFIGANQLRNIFVQTCNYDLLELYRNKSKGLNQLLEKYSLKEIKSAIYHISIDNDGDIYIPEQIEANYILRYLEYGGEDVKPTHLLSSVINKLNNYMKGDN